jgi:exosortase
MSEGAAYSLSRTREWRARIAVGPILALGVAALMLPTLVNVARQSWSTEQGAHGPIVLITGLWLISRDWEAARAVARPGSGTLTAVLLALLLPLYAFARITDIVEIEGAAMYGSLLVAAYGLWGGAALRRLWFPLVYLLFVFPPPDTLFAMLTQPLKIAISQTAVSILHALGYPVAGSGVTIQIGPYEMLVAAACAGLNSLISLTALGLFYTYMRHSANLRYMALLVVFILPIAAFANLVRVLILLLLTYYGGEAAGQGFLHEIAGLTMFLVALLCIFALEGVSEPVRGWLVRAPRESGR